MKKSLFLSILVVFGLIFQVTAKDIYLSSQGSDTNDGLTKTSAIKSFMKIDKIVEAGDIIHVNGLIKITEEPGYAAAHLSYANAPVELGDSVYLYHRGWMMRSAARWENVMILGDDPNVDGFSGEGVSPLFQLNGTRALTFENILFTNALAWKAPGAPYASDGAVGWLRPATSGDLRFKNCVIKDSNKEITFKDATVTPPKVDDAKHGNPQGAFWIGSGNIFFEGCTFENNRAKKGGCLSITGGTIKIDKCDFIGNDCASLDDSRGGAIYTLINEDNKPCDLTITRSLFEGNSAHKDGGAICMRNESAMKEVPRLISVKIDRCVFVGNTVIGDRGGAIFMAASTKLQTGITEDLTITNSLFYGNSAKSDGGAICLWNANQGEFSVVNSTFYQNFTEGNSGHGASVKLMRGYDDWYNHTNQMRKVYNCIFDGNYSKQEDDDKLSDFATNIELGLADAKMDMKNNYIGRNIGTDLTQHPGVGATNRINYQISQNFAEYDGVLSGFDDADYYAGDYYAIPLTETAETRTFGNPAYLTQYGITKDLSGKTRIIADGKCAIGANEITSKELDDEVDFETSVKNVKKDNINLTIINGMLFCPSVASESIRFIEIYNLTGSRMVSGRRSARVDMLATGTYIVRLTTDSEVYAQKMIIK